MTVNVALVGYGYWGANLARNLALAPSVTLLGIADIDEGNRKAARAAHPSLDVWASFEELLDDAAVEGVVLATPAATHGQLALQALAAGRHVLVEKPLALRADEAEDVARTAEAAGLVAMVGHTFLYAPPVTRLRTSIESGELGAVQYLYSQRLSLGRIRSDCNALWNLGPHDVAIMLHLLGERPVEVSARSFRFAQPVVDDVCFASLAFESGIGANIHVSWVDPRKTRLMTVVGDQKMAIFNDVSADQKLWIFDAGVARPDTPTLGEYSSMGEFQWRTRAGDIVIPNIAMKEPLLLEVDDFGRCCATGETPVASAWHGVEVVRVLTAIDESAQRGGTPVEVAW